MYASDDDRPLTVVVRLVFQWLCVGPNRGQGMCQLVHGLLGDSGFRRTRLAPTTGMVNLKDDCLLAEPDDPRVNLSRSRVKGRRALRG